MIGEDGGFKYECLISEFEAGDSGDGFDLWSKARHSTDRCYGRF